MKKQVRRAAPILPFLLLFFCCVLSGAAFGAGPSVAFYYGVTPPLDELRAFDDVVLDPDSGVSPDRSEPGKTRFFAYVSLGETSPSRDYAKKLRKDWIIGRNRSWGSMIMDPANAAWRRFFVEEVLLPLWQAGYRGFFFDTLDSYRLAVTKERYPLMEKGIVTLIRAVRERFPGVRLILNRGFEVIDQVKGDIHAVAAESLFKGYNPAKDCYADVKREDRKWLAAKLHHVRDLGIPVMVIDYLPPGSRPLARETAAKIRDLGFIPWVTDKDVASLGVGSLEVMPRKILGFYDGREAPDIVYTNLFRYGVMPLNWLGYTVEMHDLRESLPGGILAGRYAGIVIWPNSEVSAGKGFRDWLAGAMRQGVKVVFLEYFGFPFDALPEQLAIEDFPSLAAVPPFRVQAKDALMGFEAPPLPSADSFPPIRLKKGRSLLRLVDAGGNIADVAGITPWGGYVLGPFVVLPDILGGSAWVTDPFRFFREALRLPPMPVPDTTTENGSRLLFVHIDGDGSISRAEWPQGGYAADEMREKILEKYRIPTSVSVITGIIGPDGLYPDKSPQYQEIARKLFQLPWVEAASHSFSHPFHWNGLQEGDEEGEHNLHIPGYAFRLDREIAGSIEYINENLLPKGKKVRLFQWSGDCVPGADAIAACYRAGVLNINGGDTFITESKRSLTQVAPLGVEKGGFYQVFAANQNENVYTDLWRRNFHGYRRVLETFRLTDSPRRLKPVNIYYHFYSASKLASLDALDTVYARSVAQNLNAIFTSEYVEKVLDFNRTVVARSDDGWRIRNGGYLREFRIPAALGSPDMERGDNVVGFSTHDGERYIHAGPGGEVSFSLVPGMGRDPYLLRVNGRLDTFSRQGKQLKFTVSGWTPMTLMLGNAGSCVVTKDGKPVRPCSVKGDTASFSMSKGKHVFGLSYR